MGLQELRYAARVDLKKPASEQPYLHVRLGSVKGIVLCDEADITRIDGILMVSEGTRNAYYKQPELTYHSSPLRRQD